MSTKFTVKRFFYLFIFFTFLFRLWRVEAKVREVDRIRKNHKLFKATGHWEAV